MVEIYDILRRSHGWLSAINMLLHDYLRPTKPNTIETKVEKLFSIFSYIFKL